MSTRSSIPRSAWARLLGADPFAKVRTDEQLARLVVETARRSRTPYAVLLARLLGSPRVDERLARDVWSKAVEHRRRLAQALGRGVHLRVAALDLVLNQELLPRPLLVDRELVSALVEEARSDALTGLPNRRHFMMVLEHELRQRHRPSLAMIDVDGFKRVNDQHGHARGDAVLRGLAEILRSACREGDVVARLGGDEFGAVFVDADEPEAMRVLRRVEKSFMADHGGLGVGLSCGVVGARDLVEAGALLEEADRRMYLVKEGRRGRASPGRPVVALYATRSPDRLLAVHGAFARAGVLVVPVRTASAARALAPLLEPRLVLCDLVFPPKGGLDLLADPILKPRGGGQVIVVPERWRGVGRGIPQGLSLLSYPPAALAVTRLVSPILRTAAEPQPALESTAASLALLSAVERLAGGDLRERSDEPGAHRPELALVRALLGV